MNLYGCMRCGTVYAGLRTQIECEAVRWSEALGLGRRCGGRLERMQINSTHREVYTIEEMPEYERPSRSAGSARQQEGQE
jgi:hypothetical protein